MNSTPNHPHDALAALLFFACEHTGQGDPTWPEMVATYGDEDETVVKYRDAAAMVQAHINDELESLRTEADRAEAQARSWSEDALVLERERDAALRRIRSLEQTEMVLRGQIRNMESAFDKFEQVVVERDEARAMYAEALVDETRVAKAWEEGYRQASSEAPFLYDNKPANPYREPPKREGRKRIHGATNMPLDKGADS